MSLKSSLSSVIEELKYIFVSRETYKEWPIFVNNNCYISMMELLASVWLQMARMETDCNLKN